MYKSAKLEQNQSNNEFIKHVLEIQKQTSFINMEKHHREVYSKIDLISIFNDAYETINVKGSVNRNRRLLQALTAGA